MCNGHSAERWEQMEPQRSEVSICLELSQCKSEIDSGKLTHLVIPGATTMETQI